MDNALVDRIIEMRRRGAAIWFARTANGRIKVKVKFGPFHMMTRRYHPDEATFEALKQRMRADAAELA
jgi:hypothetical protein